MKNPYRPKHYLKSLLKNLDCSWCSSNLSPLHKEADCEYCLHNSGELRDLLQWCKGMASKGHSRQEMGSIQDVFRKSVQRDQDPAKDISVRRLWDNNQPERRTCKCCVIWKATGTGGSAIKFGHSDGSRQAGSSRAIHQQCNANTWIAVSNSDDRNTATVSGKLWVRSNAKDRKKGTETTPAKFKPRIYTTGSRWILLVTWL